MSDNQEARWRDGAITRGDVLITAFIWLTLDAIKDVFGSGAALSVALCGVFASLIFLWFAGRRAMGRDK